MKLSIDNNILPYLFLKNVHNKKVDMLLIFVETLNNYRIAIQLYT